MRTMDKYNSRRSFTLIEMLVVLAIVAVLSTVVILALNPAELIKQSRDTTRFSDLATLNTAVNIFNTDVSGGFLGTSTIVYLSIPDTSKTCNNLGLQAPTGWTYNCVTATSTRNTNGTGWVPINLNSISAGAPISALPVDPQNTTSTSYYAYVAGSGAWQISSKIESQKYSAQVTASPTNSYDPGLYTVGTNTSLAPFVGGMVGWWTFENADNTTSTDSSGWGRNGTWAGTSTPHYVAGKVGSWAGYFNGTSDTLNYVNMNSMYGPNNAISYSFWHLPLSNTSGAIISTSQREVKSRTSTIDYVAVGMVQSTYSRSNPGNWEHVVMTTWGQASSSGELKIYVNGVLVSTVANYGKGNAGGSSNIGSMYGSQDFFSGYIDDLRVYNRILTASEVSSIYNSTK